MYFRHISVKI